MASRNELVASQAQGGTAPTSAPLREASVQRPFRDLLAHLKTVDAEKLLGPRGKHLMNQAGRFEVDVGPATTLARSSFQLHLPDAVATLRLEDAAKKRIAWSCSRCTRPCVHVAAALRVVLEEKLALGLAAPPSPRTPAETLGDAELVDRALEDRDQRARDERMHVSSSDPKQPWTTYQVTSRESGRTYRVALRGLERGDSYCSCPDFRKNTLGTCKHILHVLAKVQRRFGSAALGRVYQRKRISLSIDYAENMTFRLRLPAP
jgi:hypothetical protein